MLTLDAWWHIFRSKSHWAFFFGAISAMLSLACCRQAKISAEDLAELSDGVCLVEDTHGIDDELADAALLCHRNYQGPILYAHFLAQAAQEELCSDEPPADSRGFITCAPGAVLLANNSVDAREKEWSLPAIPDYFAWHLKGKASVDEMMYIANAQGLPVKAQFIKLEKGNENILVLFPKTSLTPGTKYYLYLGKNAPDGPKKWIQPLVIGPMSATGLAER